MTATSTTSTTTTSTSSHFDLQRGVKHRFHPKHHSVNIPIYDPTVHGNPIHPTNRAYLPQCGLLRQVLKSNEAIWCSHSRGPCYFASKLDHVTLWNQFKTHLKVSFHEVMRSQIITKEVVVKTAIN